MEFFNVWILLAQNFNDAHFARNDVKWDSFDWF